jgi:hypothetical protein
LCDFTRVLPNKKTIFESAVNFHAIVTIINMKTAYGLPKKREAVIDALQQAYASGNLDETEYEHRLSEAWKAQSLEELALVLHDFPQPLKLQLFPATQYTPLPKNGTLSPLEVVPEEAPAPMRTVMSEQVSAMRYLNEKPCMISTILGTQEVDLQHTLLGAERVEMHVECMLGSTKLNLCNPQLNGRTVYLYISGAMGNVEITVPTGCRVTREMQLFMSEFKLKKKNQDFFGFFKKEKKVQEPRQPVYFDLYLCGNYFLGEVKVLQVDL